MDEQKNKNNSPAIPESDSDTSGRKPFALLDPDNKPVNRFLMICAFFLIIAIPVLVLAGQRPLYHLLMVPIFISLFISSRKKLDDTDAEETNKTQDDQH